MAVNKMQLFSIPVSDQSRSRDFSVDTLGFELVADSAMGTGPTLGTGEAPGR